jgi:hypothetical protein
VKELERPPASAPDGGALRRQKRALRIRAALALAVGLAIVAGAAFVHFRDPLPTTRAALGVRPLAIVPPGPAFVLSVDLARLRTAQSGRAIVGRGLAELQGDACEQVMIHDVDEFVLTIPNGAELGRSSADSFALIAAGRFLGESVAACAERGIVARKGEAVRTTIGAFTSVRDRRRSGEVAARNGLLVVSDGEYLRELLDGAEGRRAEGSAEERERDRLHAELRRAFGRNAPVVATLALQEGWLRATLGDPEVERSPLATLRSAALRVEIATDVELTGLVACDDPARCQVLERFLLEARSELRALLPPEAAPALERLALTRKDARLDLSAKLSAGELAKLWPAASR